MTAGFRREVDVISALLGYYTEYSVYSVPTFRDNLSVPSSKGQESQEGKKRIQDYLTLGDGTDKLSRNVCKQLPLYAA